MKRKQLRQARKRSAFLLILVLVVVAMASLAGLTFARSMLNTHKISVAYSSRLQARMCAESGLQSVRLFAALSRSERDELGGSEVNDRFYARNVMPNLDPERRGNFTIISPAMDEFGSYSGLRYGLQNESSKLNLNALAQLDAMAAAGDVTAAATGQSSSGDAMSMLASELTAGVSSSIAADMLLAIPGMTEDIADAILDWMDEDDETRPYGAEFDYYAQLPTPYRPTNGPINSVEQLLLVRGVTPQLLFGYDVNRNGVLDDAESQQMGMMGNVSGSSAGIASGVDNVGPPALGWSQYLTVYSMEKNVDQFGEPRININASDDMQQLYDDLLAALGDETAASFIVAYRYAGAPGGDGTSPLMALATMAAAESSEIDGALGAQLQSLQAASGDNQANGQAQTQPWSLDAFSTFDLTQAGSVTFGQVLDLFDATVTVQQGNAQVVYSSPFGSLPGEMALAMPLLMDSLTTVDAPGIPGRINIMTCPQEILYGIPGLPDEKVQMILEARVDGSESETRKHETWLAVESILTMSEMRALLPLITCGGDVYKAQVVGYMEGSAAFSRLEAIVSGVGDVPEILFFRRLDNHERGFDIPTLGQRFDATLSGGTVMQ
ncbi:MAG: general secretion pathway protein GspK [Planctomycetales bacterium]|nr:general secretion pathway protein GspK [Planctomycetales bacterium]